MLEEDFFLLIFDRLSDSDKLSIQNEQYPILWAANSVFTKKLISKDELIEYFHWDATDELKQELANQYGDIPIVWNGTPVGILPKVVTE